jgi:DNA-binding CsgD family transcriptional regulator/PAS domain-containing protein
VSEADDFLATIEAAHAAALDESLWPDALKAVAGLFGAVGATIEDFSKQPLGLRYFRIAGLPEGSETAYLEHYQRQNPRGAYAFEGRNIHQPILCDYQLIDERTMDRDPYYVKFLGVCDLRYFVSGQILNVPESVAIIAVQRTRRQGHAQAADIERMRRLLPHLRQAYDVSLRLRQSARTARNFEHVLDWLSDGVATVRADGRIVHANEAFQAIARRGDGVRIRRGVVEFAPGAPRERFALALAAAARLRAGEANSGAPVDFGLPRDGGGMPYVVSVRPLPRGERGPYAGAAAVAIVFVHDPLARNPGMARLMREVFGFTEAEASVAEALRAGVPLGDYARERKVSINTVYTHLRRIKDKTGANRLPDLIRRLNDLHVPLRFD